MVKVLGRLAVVSVLLSGCAAHKAEQKPAVAEKSAQQQQPRRYVDPELGFEIARPSGQWALNATDEQTMEGVSIPVVLQHKISGAQVVVQVAPAVATPTQFAQRITEGLRSRPGFTTTDPEPLSYSDSAVGFNFAMENKVKGRVAVLTGKSGRVYMMLATWPTGASDAVSGNIEEIFQSLRVL
ncbi:MAG: hypothetical protein ACJ790_18100 [Myxococcaceae bacterium]